MVICVCFKIYFLIDHHCKTSQIRQKFLQGALNASIEFFTVNTKLTEMTILASNDLTIAKTS